MKKALITLMVAAAFAAGFGYGRWYGKSAAPGTAEKKTGYHCPMHPEIRSDKPGTCPICGMTLVPDSSTSSAAASPAKLLYYHDPRQPSYRSDRPGLNPGTGNTLEPVYDSPAAAVTVPVEKQQWIGLKTGLVEITPLEENLRVPGKVAVDETRVMRVSSRTEGWIEKVFVDFTGRIVAKGEPMLTLYSPELTASQEEYLLAIKAKETMAQSSMQGMHSHANSLVDASRRRLEHHWAMDPAQIEQLEKSGKPQPTVTIRAPEAGYVLTRNAYPSQRVTPETELYTLASISKVWIMADVFESDAAKVRLGSVASLSPSYAPNSRIRARVANILPQVDPQTRTMKVRLEADNPSGLLKPEMFVDVDFLLNGGSALTVPEDAVIDTGKTQTVYLALEGGLFEPRAVETGDRFDGRVVILSGLTKGDRIVTSGTFLLDSESKIANPAPRAAPGAGGEHRHD